MSRATAAEKAERLNHARRVLARLERLPDAIALAFNFGALTGNSVLKLYAGATDAAKTTALAFRYRLGSADSGSALADQLGDETDVAASGLTLTATTFDHKQVLVELEAIEMPDGKPWLTVEVDNTATVLNLALHAVALPRYGAHTNPTVL